MQKIPCVIMRGGTSKAVFLREADLPADATARKQAILQVFGSPDKRQIDGLGGADPLTSKLAIIGPPPATGATAADLTYTFGQVEIAEPEIDWLSLCGNVSAAVGLYALQEGLVAPVEGLTRVTAFNTNLGRTLGIEVPVEGGTPATSGDFAVPGVPGTGACIAIDFRDTAGGATGRLLPTGNPRDLLQVAGIGEVEVSLVDIGNAHVFVRAADLGLAGTETAAEIDADPALLDRLERIRGAAAARLGMASAPEAARRESPAVPILAIVSPPAAYRAALTGEEVTADRLDLVGRVMFMQQTHKTYAGTSTVCTGVAARIPGTLPHEAAREDTRDAPEVRIGHPAGVIVTESTVRLEGNDLTVARATLGRTARRILDGTVYLREDLPAA